MGKNHIDPTNLETNFIFKIFDFKYKVQIERAYPNKPPLTQTNKVILFIKRGRKTKIGVGKITHLSIHPPNTVITKSPPILINITQDKSFKG